MTFSRLVLGEPRLKGRVQGGVVEQPCEEPLTYGANILIDPGFENSSGGGPDGDAIPYDMVTTFVTGCPHGLLWTEKGVSPNDFGCVTESTFPAWMATNNTPDTWRISTANPRSGSRHARWTNIEDFTGIPMLGPWGGVGCDDGYAYGARVEEGDFVDFSGFVAASFAAPGTQLTIHFHFWNTGMTDFVSTLSSSTVEIPGPAYGSIQHSGVVPASTHYVTIQVEMAASSTIGDTLDFDDFTLEVQP